jgi:type I restriction enzyme R subunit
MSTVGQIEKRTQARVVKLFRETLGYDYLGDWIDREGNRNIEPELLSAFLKKQGHDESLITKVLYQLEKAAGDTSKSLYDRNRAVYELLRYGVKVKADVGENTQTVWLIDWKKPHDNYFAIAEEVTVSAADAKAHTKRPDVVLYVNGIALGLLELKRSTISVAEGIRQNLDNQKKVFIEHFFATMQFVMAGNDTEGLRYATIQTPEKFLPDMERRQRHREPARPRLDAALRQGALPRTDPPIQTSQEAGAVPGIYCCSRAGTSLGKTS